MTTVAWEFADGAGGMRDYDDDDARAVALGVASAWPLARVWLDTELVQRGFVDVDEEHDPA